jgi:hypothetical protein
MRNLVKFISDLILICDSKKPIWYPSTVGVDRSFGNQIFVTLRAFHFDDLCEGNGSNISLL